MRSSSASKLRYRPKAKARAARGSRNRRQDRRLRVNRHIRVPVQVFPVLPFLGPTVDGALVNLSAGGMALLIDVPPGARLARGSALRVHFRLPGMPLTECHGLITHAKKEPTSGWLRLGIRFQKSPAALAKRITSMAIDDEACESRVTEAAAPRCDLSCSFYSLCSKPIREDRTGPPSVQFEIALQKFTR